MRIFLPFVLIIFTMTGCATSPPENVGNACSIFEDKRGWYRATHRAEKKYGAPKALQLAIIRQESSFRHDARPPRGKFLFVFPGKRLSSAQGYPQALDGTWDLYKRQTGHGGADRDEFKDATRFVAWYINRSSRRAGIPKTDAYGQYLAYHEGVEGYLQGSYQNKSAVKKAAGRVQYIYDTYSRQLAGCEKKFRRGIPLIPGI
ncbi:MAG: transglycosylase SLT domain-containing protein [Pseudomonadota bacterium]